jgi:hypothetical protein
LGCNQTIKTHAHLFRDTLKLQYDLISILARREQMKRLFILALLTILLISTAGAANYMYEKASVKGVGYKNVEMIISTQTGFNGQKLVEKESGSGNVITERTEIEAERQLERYKGMVDSSPDSPNLNFQWPVTIRWPMTVGAWVPIGFPFMNCNWQSGTACPMDYINFTKEAEFEYMPVSYQTGTYDQKWIEKLCVQNYRIGAVLTEMYTHAEHLQKSTEVKTRGYISNNLSRKADDASIQFPPPEQIWPITGLSSCPACCTGVLEANLNSNVIGVAHIGWISRNPEADNQLKGRHAEYGRSVEDLTGVFSIEKFIQLWGNSTCGAISVDWLPCV